MRERDRLRRRRRELLDTCEELVDPAELRRRLLVALRRLVPVDAAFVASADPATLLFTGALTEAIPRDVVPRFMDNEFGGRDLIRFADLARGARPVDWLDRVTAGHRADSERYRDILSPLGLGDELRVALRTGSTCWGFMCLHRERAGSGFTEAEAGLVADVAPRMGAAMRRAAVAGVPGNLAPAPSGPGLVVFNPDLSVAAVSPEAEAWLDDMDGAPAQWRDVGDLPVPVAAVVARLSGSPDMMSDGEMPARARVRAASGRWLVLHGCRLRADGGEPRLAMIIEPAGAMALAELFVAAHDLTEREAEVARLVIRGETTVRISAALRITTNTVQDHLKHVFEKTGVRSRRELVAAVMGAGNGQH